VQTKKVTSFPVVLLGHAYWDGLVDWLRSTVLAGGKVNARDLDLFSVTDDPAEAVRIVVAAGTGRAAPVPDDEAARKGPE
jgi:predicted Rossmann-fold nucleotide-binding protein